MQWTVYIILCSDGTYYTGITTDTKKRFQNHLNGKGAKYFFGRQPMKYVYLEEGHDRASAGRREAAIKKMPRAGKRALISKKKMKVNPPQSVK